MFSKAYVNYVMRRSVLSGGMGASGQRRVWSQQATDDDDQSDPDEQKRQEQDDEGEGEENPDPDDDEDDDDQTDDLERVKAALKKAREERRAARAKARTLQERLDAKEQEEREAADAEAERKGEFEELAKKRKDELDTATADLTAANALVDQYRTTVEALVKDGWDALPEATRNLYVGEDDDLLTKLDFIRRAEKERPRDREHGNRPGPKPGGDRGEPTEAVKRATVARYRM